MEEEKGEEEKEEEGGGERREEGCLKFVLSTMCEMQVNTRLIDLHLPTCCFLVQLQKERKEKKKKGKVYFCTLIQWEAPSRPFDPGDPDGLCKRISARRSLVVSWRDKASFPRRASAPP